MGTHELMNALDEIADASEWILEGGICEHDKDAAAISLAEIAGICKAIRMFTGEQ